MCIKRCGHAVSLHKQFQITLKEIMNINIVVQRGVK